MQIGAFILLSAGDTVYARKPIHDEDGHLIEKKEFEDCWVMALEPECGMALVDFGDGGTPCVMMCDELEPACPNCKGMLMEGCCDASTD